MGAEGVGEGRRPERRVGIRQLIDQFVKDKETDDRAAPWRFAVAMGHYPEGHEGKSLTDHPAREEDRREAMRDVVWAIIHSKEYLAHLDVLNGNDPRKMFKEE